MRNPITTAFDYIFDHTWARFIAWIVGDITFEDPDLHDEHG